MNKPLAKLEFRSDELETRSGPFPSRSVPERCTGTGYSRRGNELASFPQEHRPKQQADTNHKNGNSRGRHGKKHPRAKVFADHANQDHQPAELDNLRTSYAMTL